MHDWPAANFLAWTGQMFLLAAAGSVLLAIFRIRHPWSKLAYCHALLAICLLLPWIEPWRPAGISAWGPRSVPHFLLWLVVAGAAAKLAWLLAGLWRIRKCRISSMPMYPIPEPVEAASAVTQADAVFCISEELPGPVMLGWLTPVVLLPQSFLTMAEESQCGVACHELLHVRRHDWLVTVIEELAGALLWFNPAIWPLLAQARLAREQLVDAEVVRLTGAREAYIDALLAIARGGSGLDLAPAPLFLRKRHLTQRIHLLLKDGATSKLRLASSYASMAAMLALAGWAGTIAFPLTGRAAPVATVASAPAPVIAPAAAVPAPTPALAPPPDPPPAPSAGPLLAGAPPDATSPVYVPSAPVPGDPRELAVTGVRALTSAGEANAARALFEKARQNARLAAAAVTPPYRFDVSFTASGGVAQTGSGTLTEIWRPGTRRWTADLDGFSVTRWTSNGWTVEDHPSAVVPMRVETLRDAIHWAAVSLPATRTVRSVDAVWEGSPVTCLLFSAWSGEALLAPGRLWEETEHCIDPASGLLRIDSIAPGAYAVYGYSANLQHHGRAMPDRITLYRDGAIAADAQFRITEMTPADENLLMPDESAMGPVVVLEAPQRVPMNTPNPFASQVIEPVIVEAEINGGGNVVEEQLCAAADRALAERALELVKQTVFKHRRGTQYQLYVNVKFMPPRN